MLANTKRMAAIYYANLTRDCVSVDDPSVSLKIPVQCSENTQPNTSENEVISFERKDISSFSLSDREGTITSPGAEPKKIYPRELGLVNLNAGFEKSTLICREPDGTPSPDYWNRLHVGDDLMHEMRGFYRWIVESKYFDQPGSPQVVAYNRDLARVMCTPYTVGSDSASWKGWRLLICRINDVIFICDGGASVPEVLPEGNAARERMLRGGYHGLKLRSLLTTPPDRWHPITKETGDKESQVISPEDDVEINEFEKLYQVYKMKIRDIQILSLSNAVDALDPNGNKVDISVASSMNGSWFYGGKLLNRWSHCVLDGTPTVVIGSRRVGDGSLRAIKSFPVSTIPQKVSDEAKKADFLEWNPKVCFDFLGSFLSFIRTKLPPIKESANEVWIASCEPPVQKTKTDGDATQEKETNIQPDDPKVEFKYDATGAYRFLPKEVVACISPKYQ